MKKILSRLFKRTRKGEHSAAPPSMTAHEIALKHAATRQRLQSASEGTGATRKADMLEVIAVEKKMGRAKAPRRVRSVTEETNSVEETVAPEMTEATAAPRKGRANKKGRANRGGPAAGDFLRGRSKKTKRRPSRPAQSEERSSLSIMDAGKSKKTKRMRKAEKAEKTKFRKNSSFL